MITQQDIDRINELARKAKSPEGLTPEELVERQALRQAYISSMRESLTAHLDNVYLVDEHGNQEKLRKREVSNHE